MKKHQKSTTPTTVTPTTVTDAPATPTAARRWLTEKQAAEYLGVNTSFLSKDRQNGRLGIPFCRVGRHIRYDLHELNEYMQTTRNQRRPHAPQGRA